MYGPYYILLLFVVLIASSLCEQPQPPTDGATHVATETADWRRTNTMSLEPGEDHEDIRSSGDFFLEITLSQDRIQGSGDGPARSGSEDDEREDGQEDENGSGFEGSGHFPVSDLTPCQRAATEATANPASKYIPRCNKKGSYVAHQCDKNSADCWCVDSLGKEIAGSRRTHPAKARCSSKDRYPYAAGGKNGGFADPEEPGTPPPVDSNDGFIIETPKDETKPIADITTLKKDSEPDNNLEIKQPISRPSIIGKPGMLAGVICGAVVGLLCAVLLVMFIVYRMRKKDEGSYALDEPKRSPSLTYTKASKDREFFA